jgi:Caspase domain
MEDNQRKLILVNIQQLVKLTNYQDIMEKCLEKNLLTPTMKEIIEVDGESDKDRNLLLFNKLVHRGPTAFRQLLKILQELDYDEAHKLLSQSTVPSATFSSKDVVVDENNSLSISTTKNLIRLNSYSPNNSNNNSPAAASDFPTINNNGIGDEADTNVTRRADIDGPAFSKPNKIKLAPYTKKTSFVNRNWEVKRAAHYGTNSKLQVYSMKSSKRGVFIFVNIINFKSGKGKRTGAESDRENLITLFRELNYTVYYYEDLKKDEFYDLLEQLRKSDILKGVDSVFMCIQTHGDLIYGLTYMEFADGLTGHTESVIEKFSNINCPNLIGKPKVFFFPFCRGTLSDRETKFSVVQTDGLMNSVPTFSDIFICYGTVPGFTTHRDTVSGSWYVNELCKAVAEHSADTHLEDLLKLVSINTLNLRAEGRLQVASSENRGFNKLLFFNPKIHD